MTNHHTHHPEKSKLSPMATNLHHISTLEHPCGKWIHKWTKGPTNLRQGAMTHHDHCRFQSPTTMLIERKTNFPSFFMHTPLDTPQRETKYPFFLTVSFVFRNMWIIKKNKKQENSSEIFSFISLLRQKKVIFSIFWAWNCSYSFENSKKYWKYLAIA